MVPQYHRFDGVHQEVHGDHHQNDGTGMPEPSKPLMHWIVDNYLRVWWHHYHDGTEVRSYQYKEYVCLQHVQTMFAFIALQTSSVLQ